MHYDAKYPCPTCGMRYHGIIAAADCCRLRRESADRRAREEAEKRHSQSFEAWIEENRRQIEKGTK